MAHFYISVYMKGPNCVRILEELFHKYPLKLTSDDLVLDLGGGTGLSSLVIAKETGAKVYANDLWISAEENGKRFAEWGIDGQVTPELLSDWLGDEAYMFKSQNSGKSLLASMTELNQW